MNESCETGSRRVMISVTTGVLTAALLSRFSFHP